MTIQDIGLLQAIGSKINYLNQRQSVIAQNIANSDTPGYRPKDLIDVDFSTMLKKELTGQKGVSVDTTNEQHLPNAQATAQDPKARKDREVYEVAPAGNSVIIEEQLIQAGENSMDYNLMLNVMQKQIGMFRIALGSR